MLPTTSDLIRVDVQFSIAQENLSEFKTVAEEMIELCRKDEPAVQSYEWFFGPDESVCKVVETHSDSDTLRNHTIMMLKSGLMDKLGAVSGMDYMNVYGTPKGRLVGMLERIGANVYTTWRGVLRD